MLLAIRDRVTGWIAGVIVGLLAVTFVLFGIQSYLEYQARVFAAEVNGEEIPPQELRRAYQEQIAQLRDMLGEDFDRLEIDEAEIRSEVLERLIRQRLLAQAAAEEGMIVGDALLAARIQSAPALQEDGEFSPERYRRLVMQQGMNERQFEENFRRSLLIQQLASGLTTTEQLPPSRLEALLRLQTQTRDLSYVRLAADPVRYPSQPETAAIEAYYAEHRDAYLAPERVRLSYIEVRRGDLADAVQISDADIEARYQERRDQLGRQQERELRHILIEIPPDADAELEAQARAKAEQLAAELAAGADFAALAAEHSDDPGSAQAGGDLGLVTRGTLPEALEAAVFAAEPNQPSRSPVRTNFGLHLFEVTAIHQGEVLPLADVADQLRSELTEQRVDTMYHELLDSLAEFAFENPDSLTPAAEATGLTVQQPADWVVRGQAGEPFDLPRVDQVIYSDDVLRQGYNSELIEIEEGHALVLRVEEYEAERQRALDEVRDEVVAQLQAEHARDQARAAGEALLAQARSAGDLKAAAEAAGQPLQAPGEINRGSADLDAGILDAAYALPWPEGRPSLGGRALADGDYVVLQVARVALPDLSEIPEAQRARFADDLAQTYASADVNALIAALRERAEVVIPVESAE